MKDVVLELNTGGGWLAIGSVCEVEPPESLSSDEPAGRQVYVFGWHDETGPAVWRSAAGVDIASGTVRAVITTALVKVADLGAGPHRMPYWHGGQQAEVRFRTREAL